MAIMRLNKVVGKWNIRRVSPKIISNCLWDGQPIVTDTEMCPMLHFAARIDTKLQAQLVHDKKGGDSPSRDDYHSR